MKKLLTSLFVTGVLLSANAVVLADTCNMPAAPSTTYEYTATNNSDCGCPNKKKDTCKENKKACNDNCKSAYKNTNDCDCGCQKEKDPCDPCKKNTGFFGFFRNMFNR